MYSKLVRFVYGLQLFSQGLFCLLLPPAMGVGGAWLLVHYAQLGEWIYALLITLGALCGLWSMIRYILKVSVQVQAMDRADEERRRAERRTNAAADDTDKNR